MPAILKKPLTISNKAIHQLISGDIAYEIVDKDNPSDKISVYKPIIDKISITYTPPIEENFAAIAEALRDEAKSPTQPYFQAAKVSKGKAGNSTAYGINVNFVPSDGNQAVLIQCRAPEYWGQAAKTGNAPTALLRFEFNPAKLGGAALLKFDKALQYISTGHFGYAALMEHGNTTRIDVAVDIVGLPTHRLIPVYGQKGKGNVYLGLTGRAETFYLGMKPKKNGKLQSSSVSIYNKSQEAIDTGAMPPYSGQPTTRVEFRIKTQLVPIKLGKLSLPFQKLTLYAPSLIKPPEPEYLWQIVCEAMRYRGPEKILSYLPEDMEPTFADAVASVQNVIWKAELLSKYWPEAVAKLIGATQK